MDFVFQEVPWIWKFKTLDKKLENSHGIYVQKIEKKKTISSFFFPLTCRIQIKMNIQIVLSFVL